MKLLIGLGNPGAKYAGNRHNIGFMALDRIAADHGFSPWKSKFQALASEGSVEGEKLVLLKPQTFMNNSGQSVGEAMRFYKLTPADVVVLHDELDLAPGKCRVKQGGGHAGHNGLRSIHAHISPEYTRVRLGIGHPGHKDAVAGYVLRDFPKADQEWFDDLMRGISDGAAALSRGDGGKFMNAVALRVAPPRSSTTPKTDRAPGKGGKHPRNIPAKPTQKKAADSVIHPREAKTASDASPDARSPAAEVKPEQGTSQNTAQAPADPRSKMQQLIDKFK